MASSLQLAFGDKGAWKEVQWVHSVLTGAPSPAPRKEPPSTSLAPSPATSCAPATKIVQLKIEPEEDVLENFNHVNGDLDKEEVNAKESVRDISDNEECDGCGFQLSGRNRRSMMNKHKERCTSKEGNLHTEIMTKKSCQFIRKCVICVASRAIRKKDGTFMTRDVRPRNGLVTSVA